ncbi:hypothetical protein P691DRAFT_325196 [Macrolepiota fuliginosa MF-IS2]|uniref:Brain protein I3 n=1 Tax=Macrolepiota fuliginosa MF-IS2 TaxID=1400762 RepID=A0A9P5X5Y4_9AGAR|nr:hypothetical protein P691DRAFT_325196 [Macrolepiota fuliginosa MF-IS2]
MAPSMPESKPYASSNLYRPPSEPAPDYEQVVRQEESSTRYGYGYGTSSGGGGGGGGGVRPLPPAPVPVPVTTPVFVNYGMQMCHRGHHDYRAEYGIGGILCAIFFFPFGLLGLCIDRQWICRRCGARRY